MSGFNVSRFANPNLTEDLRFECRCPGAPHETDIVVVRQELGAGEEARAGAAGWAATNGEYFDWEAATDKLISIGVVRWTFLDSAGEPMPVTPRSASLLDEEVRQALAKKMNENTATKADVLPKRSGAASRRGTRATRSPARKTATPG
ncbi:MAG: hypothetical protein ABIR11_07140 [Candidatus Limnocylindrales bacterium]